MTIMGYRSVVRSIVTAGARAAKALHELNEVLQLAQPLARCQP
jgi:hypothetical protein